MSCRLKKTAWRHGSLEYNCQTLWVQQTPDGWFAKLEDEPHKLIVVSGPWPTEVEAQRELMDGCEKIVVGTEGE
jgi:hypothetical protein